MAPAPDQLFDIPIESIVPEYASRNPLARWLFHRRLTLAARMAWEACPSAATLVDLGCGVGLLSRELGRCFPDARVLGIDLNVNLSARGTRANELRARQDIEQLGVREGMADCIFCLDVLEHFKDPGAVLAECRRVLRKGGLLVTSAPTESWVYRLLRWVLKGIWSEKEGPCAGGHHQDARSLHARISVAGFECLRREKLPGMLLPVLFELRVYRVLPRGVNR